jgi:hypothetical protein
MPCISPYCCYAKNNAFCVILRSNIYGASDDDVPFFNILRNKKEFKITKRKVNGMNTNINDMNCLLHKWQKILRLQDWDIKLRPVDKEWRKTGDIKIDMDDRTAVLLINVFNPKQTNLEELIIHELLHLKLYSMDQMIDSLIESLYGCDENDPKRNFAYYTFMTTLESTVNDLAKSFLEQSGDDKEISFGRLACEVKNEIGE